VKNLILLTNEFPYGNWEPYLETEIKYYDVFERVYICALQLRKEHKKTRREIPLKNAKVCAVEKAPNWVYLLYSITALTDKNLYRETIKLVSEKRFTWNRFIKLMVFISRSHYEANALIKFFKKEGLMDKLEKIDRGGYIYSYRFEYHPYVGILLAKHLQGYKVITRAHRSDLYEEERDVSYIPMREHLLEKLDRVVLIADDGKNYLAVKYPAFKDKLEVSRLGTMDYSVKKVSSPHGKINLVSCSTIYHVKRVHLIVEALAKIDNISVEWTHYGEGEQLEKIKNMCANMLSPNITYSFRGFIDNSCLMKEYTEKPYHLFVNVSESEGIPVSIMEALSFGIPCIATDVGGTREIVRDKYNGILLEKDFEPEVLADWISYFAKLPDSEYQAYRNRSRLSWQENYDADRNYKAFVNTLK
jgi:glycosyltransferase involved in cell wall biosynthesis